MKPLQRNLPSLALAALALLSVGTSPFAAAESRISEASPEPAAAPAGLPLGQGDLRRLLAQVVRETGVPGLVARLATPDGFVAASFGVRERGAAPVFEPTDPVHVGSCLKAMTATVVGRLVDRGTLRWDTTIAEVLPELAGALDPALGTVTFDELLAHRSGLTDDVSDELVGEIAAFRGSGREARERFLPEYLATQPLGRRGEFSYSNVGYALAGSMLERVTDTAFEELLRREVFVPLGMRSARFGAPGSNDPRIIDAPRGHGEDHRPLLPAQQWDPSFISPAGTYSMTMADWSKFALAQLGRPVRGQLLLSPAALQHLQTAVGGPLPELGASGYALGWLVLSPADPTLLAHDGSNTAWLSQVVLNRDSDRILLLSTNEFSDRAVAAVRAVTGDARIVSWLTGG